MVCAEVPSGENPLGWWMGRYQLGWSGAGEAQQSCREAQHRSVPCASPLFQVNLTCENTALLGELISFYLSCVFVCLYSAWFHLVIEGIYGGQDP